MAQYGLLGGSLKHSLSPQIHKLLCGYEYDLFEMEEDKVADFLKKADFSALNVTIPYKKSVMPYLSFIDDNAVKIGSVNTIKKQKDGSLWGYNTDYFGFSYLLDRSNIDVFGKKAIILGSGGSSVTVDAVLRDRYAREIVVISRSGENNYDNLSKNYDAEIIINTTPVGMFPKNLESPIDINCFNKCDAVVDIIYNPLKTKLLLDAEANDITVSNGLSMLVAQAKRAAEIFIDKEIADSEIERVITQMEKTAQNIVLVGMPGCGKSTVGKLLAQRLNKDFIDTDAVIEELAGKSIPEIFKNDGEEAFRKIESEAADFVGKKLSTVISTGGGIIKKDINTYKLRQNGFVVYLNRKISDLSTEGRPLSTNTDRLYELFEERDPLYKRISDITVDNYGTPDETADYILSIINAEK